ncbi:unnamed protein product [Sphenostylis stenocarpa]|uniref:SHSP domain-containing protein n=1 Tax=Sphenostylis stenocarpa TaxID=92480 RepID=A0AA86W0U5_9FABA|nr:unnamed protein product [Sphenostylis stenocarpa]
MTNAETADPNHEFFVPPSDWDHQKESDTIILMLPGFRKEELKVQVSSNQVLKLSGARKISDNKWRRFRKEVPLHDSYETSGINAKFEAGMLYVKLPKVIKPQPPTKQKSKPVALQQLGEKEPTEDKTEESKTEEQPPPPPPQEPKADPQKEMSKAETEDINRTSYEAQEMGETTQTTFKEQTEDHEDSEEKVAQSQAKTDDKEMEEAIASKAKETGPQELKSSVANMNKILDMISHMVLEVKKQKKVANLVIVFLVLFIGLYLKGVVKSSFAGPKNREL